MSERSLIVFTGAGGSGKTNLAARVQRALDRPENPVDHISIGDYVRSQASAKLADGAMRSAYQQAIVDHLNGEEAHQPFAPEIIDGIVFECLSGSNAQTVLLDGFPRYPGQVSQLFEDSVRTGFYTRGAIITYVNEGEAVRRMVKRTGERATTEKEAWQRYWLQKQAMKLVLNELEDSGLHFRMIDTYAPKERTLVEAYDFIAPLLNDPPQSHKEVS